MHAKVIKGYPVVNLEDGTLLGRVQELIINPAMKKVEGMAVGGKSFLRGSKHRVIPYGHIYNVGKDVLIIKDKENTFDTETQARIEASRDYSFTGSTVISSSGDYIAKVQDFTFSEQTGEIESLQLTDIKEREKTNKNIYLSIEGVINLGKDYVIAVPDYITFLKEEHPSEAERAKQKAEETVSEEALKEDQDGEKIPQVRDLLKNVREIWDHLENEISSEGRELARESREKMKSYILNKKANYTIKDNEGRLLVESGMEITGEVLQEAEARNKIASLFLAVISHELEENLRVFKDKLGQIFIK